MSFVTIKDIAKEIGVSPSTVSRALRNDSNIKEETKLKIQALAKELGYEPNYIAVSLKQKQSKTIGIIVPEMITTFFITIIDAIQEKLSNSGYKIIITQSRENADIELNNLRLLETYRVDGIIMSICDLNKNAEEYLRLIKKGIQMVFFDRLPSIDAPKIGVNDYTKAFFLVQHLILQGRKRIVHLAGPDYLQNAIDRKKGYIDALKKYKIAIDQDLIISAGINYADGEESVKRLIEKDKKEFDAIFCFTDILAIGAKQYLQKKGYKIPETIALAGFSGSFLSSLIHPQLTTVEQPLVLMGHNCADLMLEKIKSPTLPNKTIILDAEIKYRGSTDFV